MKIWNSAILINKRRLTPSVMLMRFKLSSKKSHIPGQYYSLKVNLESSEGVRDYSATNKPNKKGELEFAVELLKNGEVSPVLHRLKLGNKIEIKGPLGSHFNIESKNKNLVLIAGGTGIAPFISAIKAYRRQNILLITSFNNEANIPYYKTITKLKKQNTNFEVFITLTKNLDKDWKGPTGRITQKTLNLFKNELLHKDSKIFICGPSAFVKAMEKSLAKLRINEEKIKVEYFG